MMGRKPALLVALCGGVVAVAVVVGSMLGDPNATSPALPLGHPLEEDTAPHGVRLIEPSRLPLPSSQKDLSTDSLEFARSPGSQEQEPDDADEWLFYGPKTRDPIPSVYFDQFYPDDLTLEQLTQMKELSRVRMREKATELFDLRYEAGLYELREQVPLEEWPEKSVAVAKGDGPTLQIRSGWNGDAENVHVLWLPFDEYPDYYELKDEWAYLAHRVVKAKKLVAVHEAGKASGNNN